MSQIPVKTFDDILTNLAAATSAVAADNQAASDRTAKFTGDSAALKGAYDADSATIAAQLAGDAADRDAADATLKAEVKITGGLAHVNPDGTVTAYEPDGNGGYTTKTLTLSTQPVPAS